MPRIVDGMDPRQIGGTRFQYSAKDLDALEEAGLDKVSLGTIAVDVTGSLSGHESILEAALKVVVKTCLLNPMADNMMLRVILFSSRFPEKGVKEVHGFLPLPDINESMYDGVIDCGGLTPLYDATFSSVGATVDYAKDVAKRGITVNAITFVLTDGQNNDSTVGADTVHKAVQDSVRDEFLESHRPVLVGMGPNPSTSQWLADFKADAGFDQFIEVPDLTESSLAKLTGWISQSFSSTSAACGTNKPSVSVAF